VEVLFFPSFYCFLSLLFAGMLFSVGDVSVLYSLLSNINISLLPYIHETRFTNSIVMNFKPSSGLVSKFTDKMETLDGKSTTCSYEISRFLAWSNLM
jgi:hypothetical protein